MLKITLIMVTLLGVAAQAQQGKTWWLGSAGAATIYVTDTGNFCIYTTDRTNGGAGIFVMKKDKTIGCQ